MKKEKWVVAANKSHARIFRLEKLQLIEETCLVHAEGRLHERDLVTDKPGTSRGVNGIGTYSLSQAKQPKMVEAEEFARQVAAYLDQARAKGTVERIYIAASPSFLGLLRSHMNTLTTQLVEHSIDKDISHLTPHEIKSYFPIGV